ncbi:unnamed protein product [Aspergillus niger]|nr:unnamed protein product [Aspergillus niger]
MNATGPPQYKRLQALRTVLGLETSHAETSGIQCVQDPVQIGAVSYAVGAEEHEIARRDDDYLNGWSKCNVAVLSTGLTQISALESSMREQKQWNQDIEETVDQIHRSLFGSGTKSGTTRGKATNS